MHFQTKFRRNSTALENFILISGNGFKVNPITQLIDTKTLHVFILSINLFIIIPIQDNFTLYRVEFGTRII